MSSSQSSFKVSKPTFDKEEAQAKLRARLSGARNARSSKAAQTAESKRNKDKYIDEGSNEGKKNGGKTETKELSLNQMLADLKLQDEPGALEKITGMLKSGQIKTMEQLQPVLMQMMTDSQVRRQQIAHDKALSSEAVEPAICVDLEEPINSEASSEAASGVELEAPSDDVDEVVNNNLSPD